MKILLLGKNGQVGWELQRSLAPLGELIALGSDSRDLCGNLGDAEGLAATVRAVAPDVIVNAGAYTAVDKAECEKAKCFAVNAAGPAVLAVEAARLGALLVHYSTDYVFNGAGEAPWQEDEAPGPLNVYGQSKLEGEQAIVASGCLHLIFRTSWIYAARGANFARTMLRLAGERERLLVVSDQVGAPTSAELVADVTAHALRDTLRRPELAGTYHLAAAGTTSWYDYAYFVIELARAAGIAIRVAPEDIVAVDSKAFPTPAGRPHNSRLATDKLQSAFGLVMPPWQTGVQRMLTEVFEKKSC